MPMRLQVKLLRVLQENQIRPGRQRRGGRDQRAGHLGHAPRPASADGRRPVPRGSVLPLERRAHRGALRSAAAARTFRCWSRISSSRSPRRPGSARSTRPRPSSCWPPPSGRATCASSTTSCGRTWRYRTARSSPRSWCSSRLGGNPTRLPSFDEARDEFTRNYLSQILQITTGNVSQAARLAKRNRTDFYKLLSRHQLQPDDFKKLERCAVRRRRARA